MSGLAVVGVSVALALGAVGCSGDSEPGGVPASSDAGTTADDDLNVSTSGWETYFSRHTVPLSGFLSGGPGKDGIPAIDEPRVRSNSVRPMVGHLSVVVSEHGRRPGRRMRR